MPSRKNELEKKFGKLYTLYDVAEFAECSIVTVRNHMALGALETVKIGGMRRVPEDALARYLGGTPQRDKLELKKEKK
jgi:hypothetical protein